MYIVITSNVLTFLCICNKQLLFVYRNEQQATLKRTSALTTELEKATTLQQHLVEEIENLKSQLQQSEQSTEKEKNAASQSIAELNGLLEEERKRYSLMVEEFQKKEREEGRCKQQLQEKIKRLNEELKKKFEEIEKINNSLILESSKRSTIQEHLDNQGTVFGKQLEQKNEEIVMMQERINTREAQIEQLHQEKAVLGKTLQKSHECLHQLARDIKKAIGQCSQGMETMNRQTHHLEGKFKNLQQQLQQHMSLLNYWKDNTEQEKTALLSLREQMHEAAISYSTIERERDVLKTEMKQLEEKCRVLEDEKQKLEEQTVFLEKVTS